MARSAGWGLGGAFGAEARDQLIESAKCRLSGHPPRPGLQHGDRAAHALNRFRLRPIGIVEHHPSVDEQVFDHQTRSLNRVVDTKLRHGSQSRSILISVSAAAGAGEPGIRIYGSRDEAPEHLRPALDQLLSDAAAEYDRLRRQLDRRSA